MITEWKYYNEESIKDKHGNHDKTGGEWKIQCVNHFVVGPFDLLSISELSVTPVIMKFIVNEEMMSQIIKFAMKKN